MVLCDGEIQTKCVENVNFKGELEIRFISFRPICAFLDSQWGDKVNSKTKVKKKGTIILAYNNLIILMLIKLFKWKRLNNYY